MESATPNGLVNGRLVESAAGRRQRVAESFEAVDFLLRTTAELNLANKARLQMTGPALKVLAPSYGKALKTLDAIRIACECGYGEDVFQAMLAKELLGSNHADKVGQLQNRELHRFPC